MSDGTDVENLPENHWLITESTSKTLNWMKLKIFHVSAVRHQAKKISKLNKNLEMKRIEKFI